MLVAVKWSLGGGACRSIGYHVIHTTIAGMYSAVGGAPLLELRDKRLIFLLDPVFFVLRKVIRVRCGVVF